MTRLYFKRSSREIGPTPPARPNSPARSSDSAPLTTEELKKNIPIIAQRLNAKQSTAIIPFLTPVTSPVESTVTSPVESTVTSPVESTVTSPVTTPR